MGGAPYGHTDLAAALSLHCATAAAALPPVNNARADQSRRAPRAQRARGGARGGLWRFVPREVAPPTVTAPPAASLTSPSAVTAYLRTRVAQALALLPRVAAALRRTAIAESRREKALLSPALTYIMNNANASSDINTSNAQNSAALRPARSPAERVLLTTTRTRITVPASTANNNMSAVQSQTQTQVVTAIVPSAAFAPLLRFADRWFTAHAAPPSAALGTAGLAAPQSPGQATVGAAHGHWGWGDAAPAAGEDVLQLDSHETLWWQWMASVAELHAAAAAGVVSQSQSQVQSVSAEAGLREQLTWLDSVAGEAAGEAAVAAAASGNSVHSNKKAPDTGGDGVGLRSVGFGSGVRGDGFAAGDDSVPFLATFTNPRPANIALAASALPPHLYPLAMMNAPRAETATQPRTGRLNAEHAEHVAEHVGHVGQAGGSLSLSAATTTVVAAIGALLSGHLLSDKTVDVLIEADRRLRGALGGSVGCTGDAETDAEANDGDGDVYGGDAGDVGMGYEELVARAAEAVVVETQDTRAAEMDGVRMFLPR